MFVSQICDERATFQFIEQLFVNGYNNSVWWKIPAKSLCASKCDVYSL